MQNRFKSPVFWAAIASQILSVLVLVGVIDTGQSEVFNAVENFALPCVGSRWSD